MRRMSSGVAVLYAVAVLTSAASVRADRAQTFVGDNTGAPIWNNRPNGDGTGGTLGSTVRYRTQGFRLQSPTTCVINSTQDHDGYLFLYRAPFNPATPFVNLVDGDDDGELGQGSSRIPHDLATDGIALASGNYVLVNTGFNITDVGLFQNFVSCDGDVQPIHGLPSLSFPGIPPEKQVWLHDRFVVAIDGISNHAGDGIATPVRFGSQDSAFFWFYKDTNFEVLLKVLNACGLNGHWWVFIAGTTNQAHRVMVGDTTTQQVKTYTRALGPAAPAVNDTLTPFPCPLP